LLRERATYARYKGTHDQNPLFHSPSSSYRLTQGVGRAIPRPVHGASISLVRAPARRLPGAGWDRRFVGRSSGYYIPSGGWLPATKAIRMRSRRRPPMSGEIGLELITTVAGACDPRELRTWPRLLLYSLFT